MWLRFSAVSRCQSLWRICVLRVHEKQSSLPPTRWRSEWHDSE